VAAITLVATVSNCFVPRLPGAHALRGILTETVFERSASVDIIQSRPAWPCRWRVNNKLGQNRVSLKGIFVWGVNSKVTKQSDHYVWKDTSERVVRRCDDTVEQEASEFLCTKTPLFEESWATKNMNKKNWNCSLRRATNVVFSKFRGWRRKTALRALLIN